MKLIPNFTQIPNLFFDELLSRLGYAEIKCLLYIFRRTYGFQKNSDNISLTQFESGITGSNGSVLDSGTGLKRKNITTALKKLSNLGIIKISKKGRTNSYSLILEYTNEVVTQSNQTSYLKYPLLVTQSNIQKKGKESIQKKDIATTKSLPEIPVIVTEKSAINTEISEIISLMEKVDPKNKTYYGNKTQRKACQFLIETYSFENVKKIVNLLQKTNNQDYFPKITSPYELQEKWQKLAIALSSVKRKDNDLADQMSI